MSSKKEANTHPIYQKLQMATPKVGLFGTFSKIGVQIRKIIKFQKSTEVAVIDEIHRNLRQMKDLDPYFQKKNEIFHFP